MAEQIQLENGATVIASRKTADGAVVLAMWKQGERFPQGAEYVTWCVDDCGGAFWGHYFDDVVEAALDFQNR